MKTLLLIWLRGTLALSAAVLLIAGVQQMHESEGIPVSGFWWTR